MHFELSLVIDRDEAKENNKYVSSSTSKKLPMGDAFFFLF